MTQVYRGKNMPCEICPVQTSVWSALWWHSVLLLKFTAPSFPWSQPGDPSGMLVSV